MTTIKIKDIRLDGGTQARAELDKKTLDRYEHLLKDAQTESRVKNVWPFRDAVEVFYDGAAYWLWDGFHRVTACRALQIDEVTAHVAQGTQRDAILASFGANEEHGLVRSSEDKRRTIRRMLNDAEWGKWSDREIARRCKVSHPTVAAMRAELAEVTGNFTSERVYVNKQGNEAVMETAGIGNGKSTAVAAIPDIPSRLVVATDTDAKFMKVVGASCSVFEITKGRIKQPFEYEGELYICTGGSLVQGMNAVRVVFESDFLGNIVSYDEACARAADGWREAGLFYYGVSVKYLQGRYVLAYPKIRFIFAEAAAVPSNGSSTAVQAYARSEVRHAIAEANRAVRVMTNETPASLYHGWLAQETDHPHWQMLATAVAEYPRAVVREELEKLCQVNPLETETAVADPWRVLPGEQAPAIREKLELYAKHLPLSDYVIDTLADGTARDYRYYMDLARAAMDTNEIFIWHAAMTIRNNGLPPEGETAVAQKSDLSVYLGHIDEVEAAEVEEMLAEAEADKPDGDEWYTPAWLIEKARAVMGVIDIDPASCPEAQETVQAMKWMGKDYYMGDKGSLGVNWVINNGPHWQPARVWLNPPYSHPLVEQFVEKLLQQIEKGYVGEAILLVNNNTETGWWHKAAAAAAVTFVVRSRIFFWRPGREDATSPRQGQTIFYFGPNVFQFVETFKDKGVSFTRWMLASDEEE